VNQVSPGTRPIPALLLVAAMSLLIGVLLLMMAVDQIDRHRRAQSGLADYAVSLTRLSGLFSDARQAAQWSNSDRLAMLIAETDLRVGETVVKDGIDLPGMSKDKLHLEGLSVVDDWSQIRGLLVDVNLTGGKNGNGDIGLLRSSLSGDLALANSSFDALFAAVAGDTLSAQLLRSMSDIGASLKNLEFLLTVQGLSAPVSAVNRANAQLKKNVVQMQSLTRSGGGSMLLGYRTNLLLAEFVQAIDTLGRDDFKYSSGDFPVSAGENYKIVQGAIEAALERVRNYQFKFQAYASRNRISILSALVFICFAMVVCVVCGWRVKRDRQSLPAVNNNSLDQYVLQIKAMADGNLVEAQSYDAGHPVETALNYTRSMMRSLVMVIRGVADKTRANVDHQLHAIDQLNEMEQSRQQQLDLLTRQLASCVDVIEKAGGFELKMREEIATIGDLAQTTLVEVAGNSRANAELSSQLEAGVGKLRSVSNISGELSVLAATMEQLAEHTNLVALNSSIQMSTVVDDYGHDESTQFIDEVGQVARQLSARAGDSGKLASSVGGDVEAVIQMFENSASLLSHCARQSSAATESLTELVRTIHTLFSDTIENPSVDAAEHSKMAKIVAALRQMDNMDLDSSETTGELMKMTADLQSMAVKLDESVAQFRLDVELR